MKKWMGITGLILAVLMLGLHADAALLIYEEFNTTGGPDYTGGLYLSAGDLGDVGNSNCYGGTIVGYDGSTAWTDSSYIEAYANLMRIRSTQYSWNDSGRAITNSMVGRVKAYGKMTIRQHLDAATSAQGYVYAGFCSSADLGLDAGALIGYMWDYANSHWDLALRYHNGLAVQNVSIADNAPYNVTQEVYWSMDVDNGTLRVWVDNNDGNTVADLIVTDWGGTVEGISHLSAGGYESGASSSTGYVYVYDIRLGEMAEDVGMLPELPSAPEGLLVREEFNTTGGPDYTNGLYLAGNDLGDAGNATCSGGTMVGFSASDAWTDNSYFEAYAGVLRVRSTSWGFGSSGRAISVDMSGKSEAFGKMRIKSNLAPASLSTGYVYAGFSGNAVLGGDGGPTIGFKWDDANSHWDMAIRYANSGGVVTPVVIDNVDTTARDVYWSMDADADTIKVWIDNNDRSIAADFTVTDWVGEVSNIAYFSVGQEETGLSSADSVYYYDALLGSTPESVGMITTPMSGFVFALYGPPDTDLHVAPSALGNGLGSDAANAAAYTDIVFWNRVQDTLSSKPVTVWFMDGAYDNGHVEFENRGSANHRLYLRGTTPAGTVLTDGTELRLRGSRNIEVFRLNFTGNCPGYAVLLQSAITQDYNDCRDITIDHCTFKNMPDLYYGAISIYGENAYNITIQNCTFDTMGFDSHAHSLYAAHSCHDILVQSNLFKDVSGHCLDFRSRVSHVVVSENEFLFTDSLFGDEGANGIALPNWNADADDQEIYGDDYTICSNRFIFDADGDERCAIIFHFSGHSNLCGYTQIPTSNDVVTLNEGGPKYKEEFLVGAGVNVPNIEIYDNTYNEHVFRRAEYSWSHYGYSSGTADIYNAFHRSRFEDGFEYPDGNPVGWDLAETPGQADVYTTDSDPAEGVRSARLMDISASHSARMDRGVGEAIARGYYRTWVKINSHTSSVYPFYSNDTDVPTIYWVYGYGNGTWRNNNGEIFSGSWTDNIWYCLEIEFDFDTDEYTVWVDNSKIADGIAIPGDGTALSGEIHIAPATIAEQGDVQVDSIRLGYYE